jgi:uncharacterized protein
MRIFDCHAYVGRRKGFTAYGMPEDFTGATVIAAMDDAGVTALMAAPPGLPGDDYTAEIEPLLQTIAAFPDRVYGYARVHPTTMPRAAEQAEDWIRNRGLHGLKLNSTSNPYFVNDRTLVYPILERLTDLAVPVLVHTGDSRFCTPALIADLAYDFPTLPFIVGHLGQLEQWADAIAMARRAENLYLETSFSGSPNTVHDAVAALGPHRVLFGSNAPYLPLRMEIEKVTRFARLTDAEQHLVMGENLRRLLGARPRSPARSPALIPPGVRP